MTEQNHTPHSLRIPQPEELKALPPDGGDNWNRLVFEQSPYLLQHAANPVNWYPWGEEAFEAASREDKPVFLSVGYATCHWCHVMERESFENSDIARLMNEAFVCIKVDREERPDIDHVYMTVTQALTGSGGWPMTVIMTPEKKPFFAGTYFPPNGGYGRPGMTELISHIQSIWSEQREQAVETAQQITSELNSMSQNFAGGELAESTLERSVRDNAMRFDEVHGGFGSRPKFPVPHNLMFLLRMAHRTESEDTLAMVKQTLTGMRLGGIYDHVGFGFHRYSTDEQWLLPHFEKMLYDQAMMAMAYTEAWQVTNDPLYAQTAEEVLAYALRDMTSPEGGFYSAEDADSEGEEGKFYVWTREKIIEVLGEKEGALFADVYTILEEGNFREESTGRPTGTNIPHLQHSLAGFAQDKGMTVDELAERLEAAREKLFSVREKRIHPLKDDKILTDWNGLMIAALAKASKAFDNESYADAGRRAAEFILDKLRDSDGRLMKRFRNGHAGLPAHLEDYAFFIWGLMELYEATFDVKFLGVAQELAETMIELFEDKTAGGFYHTAADGEELILRNKDVFDGAIPSGNSVVAFVLLRLGRMTANPLFEKSARKVFSAFSNLAENSPANFSMLMIGLDLAIGPQSEIVLAGDDVNKLASVARQGFFPRSVLLHRPDSGAEKILGLAPYLEYNTSRNGVATAYVCRDYSCKQPVTTAEELRSQLSDQ